MKFSWRSCGYMLEAAITRCRRPRSGARCVTWNWRVETWFVGKFGVHERTTRRINVCTCAFRCQILRRVHIAKMKTGIAHLVECEKRHSRTARDLFLPGLRNIVACHESNDDFALNFSAKSTSHECYATMLSKFVQKQIEQSVHEWSSLTRYHGVRCHFCSQTLGSIQTVVTCLKSMVST